MEFENEGSPTDQFVRLRALTARVIRHIPKEVIASMPIMHFWTVPGYPVRDIVATHSPPPVEAYYTHPVNAHYPRHGERILQHNITLCTDMLALYSDEAAMSVIAHEIAHGWLDELGMSHRDTNEQETDFILIEWGFGPGFHKFNHESKMLESRGLSPKHQ